MRDRRGIPVLPIGGRLSPYLIWSAVRQAYSRTASVQATLDARRPAMALSPTEKAARLRALSFELDTLADAVEQPSRSITRAERLIGDGERIAGAVRAVFRG